MTPLERWEQLSLVQRVVLAAIVVVVIAALLFAAVRLLRTPSAVLFSGLEAGDMASIARQLDGLKIGHEVDTDLGTISVAASDVHRARMAVMSEGAALHAGIGFELFDDVGLGMSEFTQRVNYQRAMQGELTRTITSLQEVERARLHLSLPERSLFEKDAEPAKASLTLKLKDGARLTEAQVRGIRNLISSSVAGLTARNVAIHDEYGNNLTGGANGTEALGPEITGRLAAKQEVERYLSEKGQTVLDRLYGVGRARLTLDAALEHDVIQRHREKLLHADLPAPPRRAAEPAEATNTGNRTPKRPAETGEPAPSSVRVQVGKEVEERQVTPGAAQRLTVSVLVPGVLDAESRERLHALIADAVGLEPARGDRMSIHAAADVVSMETAAPPEIQDMSLTASALSQGVESEAADLSAAKVTNSLVPSLKSVPMLFWVLALLPCGLVVVAAAFWHRWNGGWRSASGAMTSAQREAALEEIRRWLQAGTPEMEAPEAEPRA